MGSCSVFLLLLYDGLFVRCGEFWKISTNQEYTNVASKLDFPDSKRTNCVLMLAHEDNDLVAFLDDINNLEANNSIQEHIDVVYELESKMTLNEVI